MDPPPSLACLQPFGLFRVTSSRGYRVSCPRERSPGGGGDIERVCMCVLCECVCWRDRVLLSSELKTGQGFFFLWDGRGQEDLN